MTRWVIGRWWKSALCFIGIHESDGMHRYDKLDEGWYGIQATGTGAVDVYTRCSWCRKRMNGRARQ